MGFVNFNENLVKEEDLSLLLLCILLGVNQCFKNRTELSLRICTVSVY